MIQFNIDSAAEITKVSEEPYIDPQTVFIIEDLCVEGLGRKRALSILKNLAKKEAIRSNELKKLTPAITCMALSNKLLKLQHEGLICKKIYPEICPE
jgi:DNA-binding HxlR family transcriptional regulator